MTPPFAALAIATRGEIGVRVARACRELGVRSIALHEPADAGGAHVRAADEAAEVSSYLDAAALARAAREAGAQALHPGYGFLSESPSLAEACAAEGVVFVGPPPAALAALARKDTARQLAEEADVPVLRGGATPDGIPFPLMVKAAAGGGGRGMRVVRSAAELPEAVAAARREAGAAFGDDTVLFERYLEQPRHVEIQVLCDAHGNGVHLGERDCSLQRRHQKVLEEAPAPALPDGLRDELGAAALRLAAAVGYVGAGTAEFLLAPDGTVAFLEMNARIQVEHPVTEEVTGIDLVRRQIAIAAGQELGLAQGEIALRGHAIEVRLYAEDPDAGFLPRAGRALVVTWPAGPGIRVDAGIDVGDEVGTRYDPLLAKIVAHGASREAALARLRTALDETVVLGVVTNLPFLRWLAADERIGAGPVDTGFIEREWRPAAGAELPAAALEAAERLAAGETGASPWTGRWRDGLLRPAPALRAARGDDGAIWVWHEGRGVRVPRRRLGDVGELAHAAPAAGGAERARIASPMPGTVLRVDVREGERVEAHQTLLVLEAMKMEHPLVAPFDGVVATVACRAGSQVSAGDTLIELAGDGG